MFFKPNIRKLRNNKNVKGLLKALKHKDYNIRWDAARALQEVADLTNSKLVIRTLNDKDAYSREIAADILGEIKAVEAIDSLIQALNDNVNNVQISAAKALANIGDTKALEPLIQKLKSDNYNVRFNVAKAIGKLNDQRGIEPLIQMLKNEKTSTSLHWHAKEIFMELGDRAVDSCIHSFQNTKDRGLARTLGGLGNPKAITPLIQAFKEESDIYLRSTIASALTMIEEITPGSLSRITKPKIIDLFVQALEIQPDWPSGEVLIESYTLQRKAGEVLLKIGEPAIAHLIHNLKDKDRAVRERAAQGLDAINWKPINIPERIYYLIAKKKWDELEKIGKPAIEQLIQLLTDEDVSIRKEASEALNKIGWEPIHSSEIVIYLIAKQEWDALAKTGNLLNAAEVILDELFKADRSRVLQNLSDELLKNLFGDYTTLILDVSSYYIKTWESRPVDRKYDETTYNYDVSKSNEAIQKLCQIHTQISTNVLHKVLQYYKRDIKIIVSHWCAFYHTGTLSFESQRKMARDELARRGNPPYDPTVYLNKDAWRI